MPNLCLHTLILNMLQPSGEKYHRLALIIFLFLLQLLTFIGTNSSVTFKIIIIVKNPFPSRWQFIRRSRTSDTHALPASPPL
jgi:hypothetical protein